MKTVYRKFTAIICFLLTLVIAFAFFITGCNSVYNDGDYMLGGFSPSVSGSGSGSSAEKGDVADAPSDGVVPESPDGIDGEIEGDSDVGADNSQTPNRKLLTAAEWRDAHNYEFWLSLFDEGKPAEDKTQSIPDGIFHEYLQAPRGLNTSGMHEVKVTCGENPVIGAKVKLYNGDNEEFSAVTDSTGTAYVFGNGTRIEAVSGENKASAEIADGVIEIALSDYSACNDELEIMLVVDTTGSMGDELRYLCKELSGVVQRVSSALNCDIRLGLLFYRDDGDKYVTRKFDFVEVSSSSGLNTVIKNINAQEASGGGDYPEAVDKALSEAVGMSWHENSKTRLLFHVLDAPYHDEQEYQSRFASAVYSAAGKGIRIIPVAASGLDTLGQYIMRSAALLTGGTYTFLTDDSGIGDTHELPAVGEFTVEFLSDLMVRVIKGFYTGTFEEPIPWNEAESIV